MTAVMIVCGLTDGCPCRPSGPDPFSWHECWCCGGWMHSDNPDTGEPDVPIGEPGICGRYCSTDCHESAVTAGWHQCEAT
jgi:hypothetical protein